MGQVPAKYMLPSAPYGQSDAANSVNAVQPAAVNPQTPLLPPNFTNPGISATPQANPFSMNPVSNPATGGLGQLYSRFYQQ